MIYKLLFLLLIIGLCVLASADDSKYLPKLDHQPSEFKHPGVLLSLNQLEFTKEKLKNGEEPWKSAFVAMANSSLASLNYKPKPRETVECGSSSNPNFGCTDERNDALAAYTHALLWFYTDDKKYAQKAIEIMDAWSGLLKAHNNTNSVLQAAWSGASFSRAAEIIAHTFVGTSSNSSSSRIWANQNRFRRMMKNVFVPKLFYGIGCKNGNWELIVADALIGIGVYLEDRRVFRQAIRLWRQRIQSYIYLSIDGHLPNQSICSPKDVENCPPRDWIVCPNEAVSNLTQSERDGRLITFWLGQKIFVDGISQETCRDFGHMAWGIQAASHVAETAWHQRIDLYAEMMERLVLSANFHATYDIGAAPIPNWLCNGTVKFGLGPVFEVLYNHYTNRLNLTSMPAVAIHLTKNRPMRADYFYAWETLTHANNPN